MIIHLAYIKVVKMNYNDPRGKNKLIMAGLVIASLQHPFPKPARKGGEGGYSP